MKRKGSSKPASIEVSSQRDPTLQLPETKRPNAKEREFLERVWMGESKKDAYLEIWPDTPAGRANDKAYYISRKSECRAYYEDLMATADTEMGLTKPRLLRGYEEIFEDENQPTSARISAGQETPKIKGFYEAEKLQVLGILQLIEDDGTRI